jgi:hypothetical protein
LLPLPGVCEKLRLVVLLLLLWLVDTAAIVPPPPLTSVAVGLVRVAIVVPPFLTAAVTDGVAASVPPGTSTHAVTPTVPPTGIVNASAKFGVCVNVADPPLPPTAGLIDTTPSVHVRESLAVYAGDTVAAPAMELVAAFTCRLLLITQSDVCEPPTEIVRSLSPCSMLPTEYTTSPLAEAYAALSAIAVPVPVFEVYVPSGVV